MKKYIVLLLLIVSSFSISFSKEMKTKEVPFGELLKVEILANYHIDNIQWFKDGVPIKGANQREFIVKNARLSDEGVYYATMLGPCQEMTSSSIFVKINIDHQPAVATITAGESVLLAADPNPASEIVKFKFNINESKPVKLTLNDLLGNQIATIFDGVANEGPNFIEFNLNNLNLTNGTYFYTIISDNYTETRSIQILR